jgi:O-antigen/teichoic acid export membrane protein
LLYIWDAKEDTLTSPEKLISGHMALMRNKLKQILPKGEFGRNTAKLAGSTAFGQGVGILIVPLLSRLYAPEDFGIVAIYISILSIFLVFSSLRYEWAIPIAKDDETAANLLGLSLLILLSFSLFVALGIWVGRDQIINWGYMSPIKPYLWFLFLGLLGAGSYQVLNAWAIRKKNFSTLAKTKVRQSLSGAVLQLGLGLFKTGPFGLLLGNVVSQAAGVETLAVQTLQKDKQALRTIKPTGLQQVAYRYYQFPVFSTGSSLVNTAGLQIMPILLAAFHSPTVVGWFALSQKVIGIPSALIGNAVSQTFWAEAARLINENPSALQKLFYKLTNKLLVLSLLIVTVGIVSPWVFEIVFGGSRWRMAGIYSLYLTPMFATQFVVSTLSHLSVHELQHWQFIWDAGRLALTVICLWVGSMLGWSPGAIIGIYSLLMTGMYGVLYLLNVCALWLRVRGQ